MQVRRPKGVLDERETFVSQRRDLAQHVLINSLYKYFRLAE